MIGHLHIENHWNTIQNGYLRKHIIVFNATNYCEMMLSIIRIFLICFCFLNSFCSFCQLGNENKFPSYFGVHAKLLLPSTVTGNGPITVSKNGFTSTLTQNTGYSFGASVRAGITKLIAFETGINFTQRNFSIQMDLADSMISGSNTIGFIQYDIPLNALIYIQLSKIWYANASIGMAVGFKPTNIGIINYPGGLHTITHTGYVKSKIGLDINGNFGVEYRTKKRGIFNLGGSVRIPLKPLFQYIAVYSNQSYRTGAIADVNGSYLTLDLKYFLPLKRGNAEIKKGPIE